MFAVPSYIQSMVNTATAISTLESTDQLLVADNSASDVNKKITLANFSDAITPWIF